MEVVVNYVDLSSGEQEDVLGMVDSTSDKAKLLESVIAIAHANSSSVLQAAKNNIDYLTAELTKLRNDEIRYNALYDKFHQCGNALRDTYNGSKEADILNSERAEISAQIANFGDYDTDKFQREITKYEVPLENYTDKVSDITSGSFTYFLVGEEAGKIHVVHERHSMVNSAFDVILKRVGHDELNTL